MAESKKRGFHALEERIHQLEEEDAKSATREAAPEQDAARRTAPESERPARPGTPRK